MTAAAPSPVQDAATSPGAAASGAFRSSGWAALRRHPAGRADLLRWGATPALVARHAHWGRPVYLASPYTLRAVGPDGRWSAELSEAAMAEAAREVARLLEVGVTAISPVVLSAAALHATMFPRLRIDPFNPVLWEDWCRRILTVCAAVVVPEIRGWSDSIGIRHEVASALAAQMPVFIYASEVPR
ncbi:DUF1937 family protein [Cereibacter sphaeroides]|uniref:DUF1937 family protein n=1 Tax=Cereibacter sphaeroides TaxID=1063 RepID=A0AAX1UE53_CERSP|nr:DUF1937 family protein [Cereibacter sphaeroides]RHZ90391.1 DUF1937 family protein [Cereibacter sphaeroides]